MGRLVKPLFHLDLIYAPYDYSRPSRAHTAFIKCQLAELIELTARFA